MLKRMTSKSWFYVGWGRGVARDLLDTLATGWTKEFALIGSLMKLLNRMDKRVCSDRKFNEVAKGL